jgi:hypothetical protein
VLYLLVVILFSSLLVPLVILCALLVVIGAFVALAVIGHATSIITRLAVSLHAVARRRRERDGVVPRRSSGRYRAGEGEVPGWIGLGFAENALIPERVNIPAGQGTTAADCKRRSWRAGRGLQAG